jgi:tRNA-specific 2-thiouridylase
MPHRTSEKVLVAMSGGVDSSVAAAMLSADGYDAVGLTLDLLPCPGAPARCCCSARDRMDARAVCRELGIRHMVADRRLEFRANVVQPFVAEYLRGRTPSPCALCNSRVKFPTLLAEADRIGAGLVASGHYARISHDGGRTRLLRAVDRRKDQSYFLFGLGQRELARLVLPLGDIAKAEVRRIAAGLGLPTREKPESQEACFVPDGDCAAFVEGVAGAGIKGPGEFVDSEGMRLGRHRGIHAYTVGQRRRLGIARGRRQYVAAIDAAENRVVLGDEADLLACGIMVSGASWTHTGNASAGRATVRIRSTHEGSPAWIEPLDGGRVNVKFDEPVRAAAPGQAAVFYRDDEVLGGGWID